MAILPFGRGTYDGMAAYWSTSTGAIADMMNAMEKRVASRMLVKVEWSNTHLLEGDVAEAVCTLNFANDLLDKYRICLAPVVRRFGAPLFRPGGRSQIMTLLEARPLKTGGVILRYGLH